MVLRTTQHHVFTKNPGRPRLVVENSGQKVLSLRIRILRSRFAKSGKSCSIGWAKLFFIFARVASGHKLRSFIASSNWRQKTCCKARESRALTTSSISARYSVRLKTLNCFRREQAALLLEILALGRENLWAKLRRCIDQFAITNAKNPFREGLVCHARVCGGPRQSLPNQHLSLRILFKR